MIVEVLCVCRRPPAWVADATADYSRRLARYLDLKFRYLTPGPVAASVAGRRRDEGLRLAQALTVGTRLLALDERGQQRSSAALAEVLAGWRERGQHVTLAIGGADGLDHTILERATECWSLSQLTLPHLLVQIIVAEQLYRAWSILEGHPYHRA